MPKHRKIEEVYDSCLADNLIRDISVVEPQKVKDLLENGNIYREGAIDRAKGLSKDDKKWMLVFVDCSVPNISRKGIKFG